MILYGTAAVLGVVLVDRLVLGPIGGKLASLSAAIGEEEAAIRQSLHVLVQKNRILAEGKEFAGYSVEAKNPEEEMTTLLRELESTAEQSSVSLIYVKPASTKEEKGTRKYLASLECEAQMEQVAGFFHAIESSPRLLKIERFQIVPKSRDSSIARCSLTVSKTVVVR